jgi:hypothetical protein
MLLLENIESYSNQFVIFLPSVKNNLIPNSLFTSIIYSPPIISFSGLYLAIPDKQDVMSKIYTIEKNILTMYNSPKIMISLIHTNLIYNKFQHKPKLILKISGIWENETSYGLAYKFI